MSLIGKHASAASQAKQIAGCSPVIEGNRFALRFKVDIWGKAQEFKVDCTGIQAKLKGKKMHALFDPSNGKCIFFFNEKNIKAPVASTTLSSGIMSPYATEIGSADLPEAIKLVEEATQGSKGRFNFLNRS